MTAIATAIQRLTPPTQAEMARQLGVHIQEVNRWVRRGWAAPKYAPQIERLTKVSCSKLVADIPDRKHGS